MRKKNILLVGFGSQGTRIAQAVSQQPDMNLVGIGCKSVDLTTKMATKKGYPLYLFDIEMMDLFEEADISITGLMTDILPNVDIVIDAAPPKVGIENKNLYLDHGAKAIFQAGFPFNGADIPAFIGRKHFSEATTKQTVRLPSPDMVALYSAVAPIIHAIPLQNIVCTSVLPGSEPMRNKSGPVNTLIPGQSYIGTLTVQREFSFLFKRALSYTPIRTPTDSLAIQTITLGINQPVEEHYIKKLLLDAPRTVFIKPRTTFNSTDMIFEYVRRVKRPSGDIYECFIWEQHIAITDHYFRIIQAFDPHCVHTPEIIDAARALTAEEALTLEESMQITDTALHISSNEGFP